MVWSCKSPALQQDPSTSCPACHTLRPVQVAGQAAPAGWHCQCQSFRGLHTESEGQQMPGSATFLPTLDAMPPQRLYRATCSMASNF